jgi:hypothetical protein
MPLYYTNPDAGAQSVEALGVAAVKFDGEKPRFDLIPPEAMIELAQLYSFGAQKYCDRNWEKGFRYGRTFAAMMRHAWAWFGAKLTGGDGVDPETGQSHMVSVAWNAFALITFEKRGIGIDDRPTLIPGG